MDPVRLGLVLAAAATALPSWLRLMLPVCPLRAVTGIACPTCGGTRAVLALLRGDVTGSLAWNPFVALGLAGLFALGAAAWIAPARVGRGLAETGALARTRRGRLALVALLAASAAWQTAHL